MLELPSKVRNKEFLRVPLQEKVIDSDEEWSRCGMWILTNRTNSLSWVDEVWSKLQVLLNNGTLLMIKASTAAMENIPGTVNCYTRPGIDEIKRVAKKIRKTITYKSCMYYKINAVTENKIHMRYGHKRIAAYMYTFKGFFYKASATCGWTLMQENDKENISTQSIITQDIKEKMLNPGIELPSRSNKLFLVMPPESIIKKSKKIVLNMNTICSLEEDEYGLTDADKLWTIGRKLIDRGFVKMVTCKKDSATAEFRLFTNNTSSFMPFVKICDIIYTESNYRGFIYFFTSHKIKYRYSAEGELYGNEILAYFRKQN